MGRDDGVVRNYNGIGGRISSDNTAPIRRSASVVDAIVGETADGGNDSRDEKTERSDHEDGGVSGIGMSRYSVRATCPDVLAVQDKLNIIAKVP
jgi:hypothetical protein